MFDFVQSCATQVVKMEERVWQLISAFAHLVEQGAPVRLVIQHLISLCSCNAKQKKKKKRKEKKRKKKRKEKKRKEPKRKEKEKEKRKKKKTKQNKTNKQTRNKTNKKKQQNSFSTETISKSLGVFFSQPSAAHPVKMEARVWHQMYVYAHQSIQGTPAQTVLVILTLFTTALTVNRIKVTYIYNSWFNSFSLPQHCCLYFWKKK